MSDVSPAADLVLDGRYRLVERIPDWGVGECWRARDTEAHRRVVVKFLPAVPPNDHKVTAEFQSLAKRLMKLQHRSVVATLAAGFLQGRPYLVQEHLDGVSLGLGFSRARSAMRLLEPGMLANLLDRACEGVEAAHRDARPLVHGGLTPRSIVAALVDDRLVVRVLDFGLGPLFGARLRDRSASEYVAPELEDEPDRVTPACDVFALGAIVMEAITDRRTASGGVGATVGGLSAVAKRRDDVPTALMGVASRATRFEPDGRFADVAALREALAAAWSRPPEAPSEAPDAPREDAPSRSWERYAADATPAPSLDMFTSATPHAAPMFTRRSQPEPAPAPAPATDLARTVAAEEPTTAPSPRAPFDATLVAQPAPAEPRAPAALDATLVAQAPRTSTPHATPAPFDATLVAHPARAPTPTAPDVAPDAAPARRAPLAAFGVIVLALLGAALWWALGRR